MLPPLLSTINLVFPAVEGGDKMKARTLGFLSFSLVRERTSYPGSLHPGTTGMQDLWLG